MSESINTRKVIKFMNHQSFRNKKLWLCFILLPVSAVCISTAVPYIISNLLAKLAQSPENFRWQTSVFQLLLVGAIGVTANRLGFVILLTSQAKTLERVENEQLDNLLAKDGSFYADRMAGKIVSDSIGLTSAFIQYQDLMAVNLLPFLVSISLGIIIVSLQSVLLGVGLFFMSATVIAGALYASRKRKPLRIVRHEALRNLRGHLSDVVTNSQTVKIFAREESEQKEHSNLNSILTSRRLHEWKLVSYNGNNRIITILLMQVAFISLVIFLVSNDPALLSTGIFAFAFTITLTNRLFEISTLIRGFETAVTDAAPMIDILDEPPKITDVENAPELTVTDGSLELQDVTFSYAEGSKTETLFDGLTISIDPGEKVGLVGHSGGGKTTITKLLLRLVDIQSGNILIDGQDIAKVTQQSLRNNIAFVPQEPLLFHRTVLENIRYGMPSASRELVQKTSKLAHADEFISRLPKGYDTVVGERGVKLSGGQRQRVAIARAMLKNAPILVLDEATSALDSESEVLIQKALWTLMENRTAVVIAHRLSTIQKMDRIIVLREGKILEQGSHKELLARKGQYAELWAHQSGGFIED